MATLARGNESHPSPGAKHRRGHQLTLEVDLETHALRYPYHFRAGNRNTALGSAWQLDAIPLSGAVFAFFYHGHRSTCMNIDGSRFFSCVSPVKLDNFRRLKRCGGGDDDVRRRQRPVNGLLFCDCGGCCGGYFGRRVDGRVTRDIGNVNFAFLRRFLWSP